MDTIELERFSVPFLKAGTFPYSNQAPGQEPLKITEDELDDIINASNRFQPVIQEAIQTGQYRGNEHLILSKPVPGVLNVKHQNIFPEILKKETEGVKVSYHKEEHKGEPWAWADFENVRSDIAKTLQAEYPLRSAELLGLTDPDTGEYADKVCRSIAFLPRTTRPAVDGQSPEFLIECAGPEDPLTIITTDPDSGKGANIMAENTHDIDVAELQKEQAASMAKIAELEAERAERDAKELALKSEVAELRAAQDRSEVAAIEKDWMGPRVFGKRSFILAPAARELLLSRVIGNGVVELSEGETQRSSFVKMVDSLVEMAGNGTLLVQTSLEGVTPNTKSGEQKPKTVASRVKELMADGMEEPDAYAQAVDEGYEDIMEVA